MAAYISSALSNYCISSYSNKINSTKEISPVNIFNDDAITVNISKNALESLDSEKNSFVLDYTSPNLLEGTGCETIEQLQYINSRGLGAQDADDFRDYIKNFHFLPIAGSLGGTGVNVFAKMDSILKDLDVNDLIDIDKKLRDCSNAAEKLNAFSEIFGELKDSSNVSFELREELSDLSDLFSQLAKKLEKIDKNSIMQLSSDLLMNLLSEDKMLDNFDENPKGTIAAGQQKFNSSLIAKYQK